MSYDAPLTHAHLGCTLAEYRTRPEVARIDWLAPLLGIWADMLGIDNLDDFNAIKAQKIEVSHNLPHVSFVDL